MKKNYVKITVLGFVILYLVCMTLTTYLSKLNFDKVFHTEKEDAAVNITENLTNDGLSRYIYSYHNEGIYDANLHHYMNYLLSDIVDYGMKNGNFHKISAAIYDKNTGEKVAQSGNIVCGHEFDNYRENYYVYHLEDYFTDEEINTIQECYLNVEKKKTGVDNLEKALHSHEMYLYVDEISKEVKKIELVELEIVSYDKEEDLFIPKETKTSVLLEWKANDWEAGMSYKVMKLGVQDALGVHFPYLTNGVSYSDRDGIAFEYDLKLWEDWNESDFLKDYPEMLINISNDTYHKELSVGYAAMDEKYVLCIRETAKPWLAALHSMRYIYLCGALFVLLCMLLIVHSSNHYYKQRELLENTRRDFTNAIAHELKTPLGVIRGYAENSLEITNEEKREYYLKQIVSQTEKMDKLVKEMIYVSKLDSEKMKLKKEQLFLSKILEEQLGKLQPLIEEKHLEVNVDVREEFVLEGDKQYLERAVWNLLSNAAEYNRLDGRIQVIVEKNECRIVNTGEIIAEEDLLHVFEMFYTSDKSRGSMKKHMGLGLYLAEKILKQHHMIIRINNKIDGVEVKIAR